MPSFVRKALDPSTRLGETFFGLIMILGITGAARLGGETLTNRQLFLAILGCNLAWGIVDGAMYLLVSLFERGARQRILAAVNQSLSDEAALITIDRELLERLQPLTTPDERRQIYRWVLKLARRSDPASPRLLREDLLGAVAVTCTILLVTFPTLLPFLVIADTWLAVRISNLISLGLLFTLGILWGRAVGLAPLRAGLTVTALGFCLVILTILLDGG